MTSGEKKTNNKTNESFFLHMLMTIVDKYLVFRCVCVVSLSLFSLSLVVKNKKKLHSWFSVEVFEISLLAFFRSDPGLLSLYRPQAVEVVRPLAVVAAVVVAVVVVVVGPPEVDDLPGGGLGALVRAHCV